MPIMEDEHGTYIMNSKDLRAVEHVERLVKMGIDSLKIEGRTKSLYYVARTAQVYRQAIDDAVAGQPFDLGLLAELEGPGQSRLHRWLYERHTHEYQNYDRPFRKAKRSRYVGDVLTVGADSRARVEVKNRFERGDRLEAIQPGGNHEIIVGDMLRDGMARWT